MARIYHTSFCNFGHDLDTGRPVKHECYILPPEALEAERNGDYDKSLAILQKKGTGRIVRGK
jgi:hypothetical protein